MVFLPHKSVMIQFLSFICALTSYFVNVASLEASEFHDYLREFYIMYQNYYKQDINLYFRPIFTFLALYFIHPDSLCWCSPMPEKKSKNLGDCDQLYLMICLMPSISFTFIGHMPLGKASSLSRSGILFGTERRIKLFVMTPSRKFL
jgi:hypothetical protein